MSIPIGSAAQDAGPAYFAMLSSKFPCDQALEAFDDNAPLATAILWNTFGTDTACLARWFKRAPQQRHILEIHLTNEACRRNARCERTEFAPKQSVAQYNKRLAARDPGIIGALEKRITAIRETLAPYSGPKVELILSTGLEDNYSKEAYVVVLETVKKHWPHRVVRSPVHPLPFQEKLEADFLELHGDQPPLPEGIPCIANLDGVDISFPHRPGTGGMRVSWDETKSFLERFRKRCSLTFLWAAPWQGIDSDSFVVPSEREFSVDSRDVAAIRMILGSEQ